MGGDIDVQSRLDGEGQVRKGDHSHFCHHRVTAFAERPVTLLSELRPEAKNAHLVCAAVSCNFGGFLLIHTHLSSKKIEP